MTTEKPRRVLLFGSDGLRPDLVTEESMPTLAKLMRGATRMNKHRTVYPSITRAVLSSINTGVTPGRHGMTSGSLRYDNATENHIVDSGDIVQLNQLDDITGGNAIQRPTFGDHLEAAGLTMALSSSQATGGGAIWARKQLFPTVNTSTTYGRDDLQELRNQLGGDPPENHPLNKNGHVTYAARSAAEIFVPDPDNRLIVAWLAEPDSSFHKTGLGSPESFESMKVIDNALAMILESIEAHGFQDDFNIMVVSDHGHATIDPYGSLDSVLKQAALDLGDAMPRLTHTSRNFYPMPNEEAPTAEELAPFIQWLQAQPWVGALFGGTDEISALPGMLSLKDVWNGTYGDRAPLIATAGAWSDVANEHGAAGTVRLPLPIPPPSLSAHGNLSPWELTAFAAFTGPDFQENRDILNPTGSVDIMPTILHLLDVDVPTDIDGRVLHETLLSSDSAPEFESVSIRPGTPAASGFSPELKLWKIGHTSYIDECVNGQLLD